MKSMFQVAAMSVVLLIPAESLAEVDEGRADVVPWSGYWWPTKQDSVRATLERYDRLTGHHAARWERDHSPAGPNVPTWHGYCHGWAASAVLEREPRQSRSMTGPNGLKIALSVGDQKALLALCHTCDIANVHGQRCRDSRKDDPNDLSPDALWRLLTLYVKRQGVPLILDVEAGSEVWNYPVYAYRVEYAPAGPAGEHLGTMILWMADNDVPADFVGLKVRRHTYSFRFRMIQGSVIGGSGRWEGASRKDHPDFAWYPFVAVPENPELDYAAIRRLLVGPPYSDDQVADFTLDHLPVSPDVPEPERPFALSPTELAELIAGRTSAFHLDVTVDRFDGGRYTVGESYTIRGTSGSDGFLTLLHVTPDGKLRALEPARGAPRRVTANKPFQSGPWPVRGPAGTHRVMAVVTTRPLMLTGLRPGGTGEFRLPPSQWLAIADRISLVKGQRPDPPPVELKHLGRFAQDEVAFDVRQKR